jgi:hypothetical protein
MKLKQLLKGRSPEGSPNERTHFSPSTTSVDTLHLEEKVQKTAASNPTETQSTASQIITPSPNDVLFGRGKPYQAHEGNVRLHKMVKLQKQRYLNSRRYDKLAIAEEIVKEVQNGRPGEPGRFMKRADGEEYWEEVSNTIAREKVSHALRGKPRSAHFERSPSVAQKRDLVRSMYVSLGQQVERGEPQGKRLGPTGLANLHSLASNMAMLPQMRSQPTMLSQPASHITNRGDFASRLASDVLSYQTPSQLMSNPLLHSFGTRFNPAFAQRELSYAQQVYAREQAIAEILKMGRVVDDNLLRSLNGNPHSL